MKQSIVGTDDCELFYASTRITRANDSAIIRGRDDDLARITGDNVKPDNAIVGGTLGNDRVQVSANLAADNIRDPKTDHLEGKVYSASGGAQVEITEGVVVKGGATKYVGGETVVGATVSADIDEDSGVDVGVTKCGSNPPEASAMYRRHATYADTRVGAFGGHNNLGVRAEVSVPCSIL